MVTAATAANTRGRQEIGAFVGAGHDCRRGDALSEETKLSPTATKRISRSASAATDDGRGRMKEGANGAMMAPALAGSARVGHRDYVVRFS